MQTGNCRKTFLSWVITHASPATENVKLSLTYREQQTLFSQNDEKYVSLLLQYKIQIELINFLEKIEQSVQIAEPNEDAGVYADISDPQVTAKSELQSEVGAGKPTKGKSSIYSNIELTTNTDKAQR